MKIDQFSALPEMSAVEFRQFTEIGVFCHEFGHDLGWPDLYDTSALGGGSNLGPGNWCLMATGAYRRRQPHAFAPDPSERVGEVGHWLDHAREPGRRRRPPLRADRNRAHGVPPVVPGRGVGRVVPPREPAEDRLRLRPAGPGPRNLAHPSRRDGAEAPAQYRQLRRDPRAPRRGGGRPLRHDVHDQPRRCARSLSRDHGRERVLRRHRAVDRDLRRPPAQHVAPGHSRDRLRRARLRPAPADGLERAARGRHARRGRRALRQRRDHDGRRPDGRPLAGDRRRCVRRERDRAPAEALRHRLGRGDPVDQRAGRFELARARDRQVRTQGDHLVGHARRQLGDLLFVGAAGGRSAPRGA